MPYNTLIKQLINNYCEANSLQKTLVGGFLH